MHTKGFFFNPYFRGTRALKALVHRRKQGEEKNSEGTDEISDENTGPATSPPFASHEGRPPMRDYRDHIKKAV